MKAADAPGVRRVLAAKSHAHDADPPVLPGPDSRYPQPMPGVAAVL